MRTIGVSCLVKAWMASLRTTFGARSTWQISTREIFAIAIIPPSRSSTAVDPAQPCFGKDAPVSHLLPSLLLGVKLHDWDVCIGSALITPATRAAPSRLAEPAYR